jgi:hypothetical protein
MHVYSFLARGLETGHLIKDDSFWVNLFREKLDFLYTSDYSYKIQSFIYPQYSQKIKIIIDSKFLMSISYRLNEIFRCVTVPIPKNSKILIQGFEEFNIIIFLIRAKIKGNKIFLIPTNNICNYRINSKRWFLRKLITIIYFFSDIVFYHNDYEKKLIDKYHLGNDSSKFFFIKYHLLTADSNASNYIKNFNSDKVISFFGPEKVDKPIESFLNLLKADKFQKFQYKIYNPTKKVIDKIKNEYSNYLNLELINQFLTYEDYDKAVKESTFLFLSHSEAYEGKLSGNICDCISKRKPFISNNISPVKEYMIQYGKIGFVYDLENDPSWASSFLNSIDGEVYNTVLKNLEIMQLDYTSEKIMHQFDHFL